MLRLAPLSMYPSLRLACSRWPARHQSHGWSKGTDTASSLVWAAVSIGVSIIFALWWPALIISLDRRQWAHAATVFVALVVTGTFSVSAALGSAMGGRANAAVEESKLHDQRAKAQAAYDTATAERDGLRASRPPAELEVIVAGAKPQCRVAVQPGSRETVCMKPATLVAELERAEASYRVGSEDGGGGN